MRAAISVRLSPSRLRLLRTAGSATGRSFSTTVGRQATWGFIGLGQMGESSDSHACDSGGFADDGLEGYPMAKNLRAKIPATDSLVIYDLNTDATRRLAEEVGIAASSAGVPGKGTGIEVAESPREVAEKSVSIFIY